jgi:hypothetical protein
MKTIRHVLKPSEKRVSQQLGQSTVEYVVLTAAIAMALGVGMLDEGSALHQLLNAFALAYKKISFAISLP